VLVAGLALAGCSATDDSGVEGPVTVYVSLPLSGPAAGDGRDAADGARLALERAGGAAGELGVRARFLDDANGRLWDPVAVGRNARLAAQDSSTAAYIGELDSEPTRASVPITNDAGIAQISPGAGAVDLASPAQGYPDSPDRYRPGGAATFARVIPSDEDLAHAAATLAARLGLTEVAVVAGDDRWSALVAEEFEQEARGEGLEVIRSARAPGPGLGVLRIPGPAEPTPSLTIETDAATASVTPALSVASLPLPGRELARAFERRFGRAPRPIAAYGYEAMTAALAAIEERDTEADGFRPGVVAALLELERPDSVLGPYSITSDGNTTLCRIQVEAPASSAVDGTICAQG
jgi:branched-chain amino acid transport system substrate-binding protein